MKLGLFIYDYYSYCLRSIFTKWLLLFSFFFARSVLKQEQ